MTAITVMGLGLMGSALARAFAGAGHPLTVWNRSPERTLPFADAGVDVASDVLGAVKAADILVVCIDNYDSTHRLLSASDVSKALAGRTLVQLSTGTPKDARAAAVWMRGLGARYLDGAILGGPAQIATEDGQVLFSGNQSAWNAAAETLSSLGGKVRYLGERPGAACALDLAWLTTRYGAFLALWHAAILCRSEGVDMGDFMALTPKDDAIQTYGAVVRDGTYDQATATLKVWAEALKPIQVQARDAGISSEIPDLLAGFFERALDAGLGQKNVMSIVNLLGADESSG